MTRFDHFINGEWIPSKDYAENRNPSDLRDVIGEYAQGGVDEIAAAIDAAQQAFPVWSQYAPGERASVLRRIAEGITAREAELADMLSREEGKTLVEATGEVRRAAATFEYYAADLLRSRGETFDGLGRGTSIETDRRPLGVVGIITPWNYPIAIPAWKTAPALAYGNTVVIKPADLTPGTCWLLAEIISHSGLPRGAFNLVMGKGSTVGALLCDSPAVRGITFTGSTAVGRSVAASAIRNGMKKVQLELGGKNPLLVMDDADLDLGVAAACDGAFGSTGQRCTASSRLIVHEAVREEFTKRLVERLKGIVVGDSRSPGTTMGPVASQTQLQQDLDYVALGQEEGGRLVFGGETMSGGEGYFMQPTLFTDTGNDWRINQEEIFGPIASIISAGSYSEALGLSNSVAYGLSAGIVTRSLARARDFAAKSEAGIITINRSTAVTDLHVPFGGVKASSYGSREQGTSARDFFTTTTTVYTLAGEV